MRYLWYNLFIAQNKKQFRGEENADGIQLWCGNTKTEYPNPPDTGDLSSGGQLSDGNL